MTLSPNEVINLTWLVWLITWYAAAAWSSPATARPDVSQRLSHRLIVTAGAYLLFGLRWSGDIAFWHPGGDAAWVCVALTLGGLGFTWWARIALGRLWSSGVTRKAEHTVISHGPYRFVRHPIYSGIILAVFATAVVHGTAVGWLGALLIVAGLLIKARIEEQFLRAELGAAQYDAYARRVPMVLPFPRV
jgi:protein-S-isoprenylcysteine O-methyltransferase Ste14